MSNAFTTDKVSSDVINMMIKQLGAITVKNKPAHINIYEFEVGEDLTIITYKVISPTAAIARYIISRNIFQFIFIKLSPILSYF